LAKILGAFSFHLLIWEILLCGFREFESVRAKRYLLLSHGINGSIRSSSSNIPFVMAENTLLEYLKTSILSFMLQIISIIQINSGHYIELNRNDVPL
jgi:hypothetical protein